MAYLSGKGIDVEGGKVSALAGGSDSISLTYSVDGKDYLFDMFRPIDKTEHGVWVVRFFENLTQKNEEQQQKTNIIHQSLKDGEEVLVNSGFEWKVSEKEVKAVFDKISSVMQMKYIYISDGNYEIDIYSIKTNDSAFPRLFILNTDSPELIFHLNIDKTLLSDIVNLLN